MDITENNLAVAEISEESLDTNIITEAVDGEKKKNYFIEGVFMQSEIKNKNSRVYPKKVLMAAVNAYQSRIKNKRGYGELGHPSEPGIHLGNVCMLTQSLKEAGNDFIGRAKILTETNAGRVVKNLIDEGVCFGVSSRGRGAVKNGVVQNGFTLVTPADIVADPSAPDAFVTHLVEQTEWVYDNGILVEKEIEELRDEVLSNKSKNKSKINSSVFTRFFNALSRPT